MKKLLVLSIALVLVFVMIGCAKVPVYKVEGIADGKLCFVYITVSGEYDEAGLKKVCKELDLNDADKTYVIYFFEPNAPRNDKDSRCFDAGMPDSDYSIAAYSMEDGEFKE